MSLLREIMRPGNSFSKTIVALAVSQVAPSCWNHRSSISIPSNSGHIFFVNMVVERSNSCARWRIEVSEFYSPSHFHALQRCFQLCGYWCFHILYQPSSFKFCNEFSNFVLSFGRSCCPKLPRIARAISIFIEPSNFGSKLKQLLRVVHLLFIGWIK